MLKLKLQYFVHLMRRTDSFEKTLMLGKIEGRRRRGRQRMRWLDGIKDFPEFTMTCMRSNQSILKEVNPEYSLKGLMLKLKLQYFVHLMRRADSLEKTLMLGEAEGRRGKQRIRWLNGITNSMDMSLSKSGR